MTGEKPRTAGRPSLRTPEAMKRICDWVSDGMSLRDISEREDGYPKQTVLDWLREDLEFRAEYARARQIQADTMDELILQQAHRVLRGEISPEQARVAIGAFQWRAMKLSPTVYGDKLQTENSTKITVSVEYSNTPSLPSESIIDAEVIE